LDLKSISEIEFSNSSHSGQIKKVIFHGFEMTSSVTQVAYAELSTGDIVEEHYHESMEEVFLILDGECEFSLDGVSHLLKKDDVIKIYPKIKHTLRSIRDTKLYYFGVSILK
jgi:mannose-6-phosphate isomerase-like protein (cupin superfamily)